MSAADGLAASSSVRRHARPLDGDHIRALLQTRRLGRGEQLRVCAEIDSTNRALKADALAGRAEAGAVLIAETQTAGRGRGAHEWQSPAGAGIYLSALLRPDLPTSDAPRLSLAMGVAVCELAESVGVRPALKWPNDVMLGRRKLAGILLELVTPAWGSDSEGALVVAGVGLNVALAPDSLPAELAAEAISLAGALRGAPLPSRDELAARLLGHMERWAQRCVDDPGAVLAAWQERWKDQGARVRVLDGPVGVDTGRAVSIDTRGALLLELPDRGGLLPLLNGTLRRLDG